MLINMLNFSLHIHSFYSYDGFNSFKAIYNYSKKFNLDVIAITDHDTIEGAFAFQEWLDKRNIIDIKVIIGEEITCLDGTHIIGLFLSDHIYSDTPPNVVASIIEQGGLVYFPHPTRDDGIFSSEYYKDVIEKGQFIEVFNAKVNNKYNISAQELANKHPYLIKVGGSDAHYNSDILKSINIVDLDLTVELKEAIKSISNNNNKIFGKINNGKTGYIPLYYKYKEILSLPKSIREIGKFLFSRIKNFNERNNVYKLDLINKNE